MNKFVIYTVITGGYDNIIQPLVVDDRFDYVLFTDNFDNDNNGVWKVKHISDNIIDDKKRLSRYPKSHPESMLSEYKASLYIDANVQILDQWVYERFISLYNSKTMYAGIQLVLTGRDCIYEHAYDMSHSYCLEHDYIAIKHCHELFKRGFPQHFGLNENNVIFRAHTQKMKSADEEWWWWIVNYSSRDQLSLMYCLWNHRIPLSYFLPCGEDTRNGTHFKLIDHDGNKNVIKVKVKKRSLIEKFRVKAFLVKEPNGLNTWLSILKSDHPRMLLNIYGLIKFVFNFHLIIFKLLRKK